MTLALRGPCGTPVRTLVDAARTTGAHTETWDGTDDSGTVVPDGLYAYTIDALDASATTPRSRQGDVLVDTRPPVSLTVSPARAPCSSGRPLVLQPRPSARTPHPRRGSCYCPALRPRPRQRLCLPGPAGRRHLDGRPRQHHRLNGTYPVTARWSYTDTRGD